MGSVRDTPPAGVAECEPPASRGDSTEYSREPPDMVPVGATWRAIGGPGDGQPGERTDLTGTCGVEATAEAIRQGSATRGEVAGLSGAGDAGATADLTVVAANDDDCGAATFTACTAAAASDDGWVAAAPGCTPTRRAD